MIVRALEIVETDLLAVARNLERERSGWGRQLLAEYRTVVETLERFPQLYPLVEDELAVPEFRNAIWERLKYRIVYEVRESEILVVAVLHTRRRSDLWHYRAASD